MMHPHKQPPAQSGELDIYYNQIDTDNAAEFTTQLARISVEAYGLRQQLGVPDGESIDVPLPDFESTAVQDVTVALGRGLSVVVLYHRAQGQGRDNEPDTKRDSERAAKPEQYVLSYENGTLVFMHAQDGPLEVAPALEGVRAAQFVCDVLRYARGQ